MNSIRSDPVAGCTARGSPASRSRSPAYSPQEIDLTLRWSRETDMRKSTRLIAAAVAATIAASASQASSHREAPNITRLPAVDATDFYLFNSYEPGREDYVTVIANYLPLQDPYGGANLFSPHQGAQYENS